MDNNKSRGLGGSFIIILILLVFMASVKYVTTRYVYGGDDQ